MLKIGFILYLFCFIGTVSCEKDDGNAKVQERDSLETVTQISPQMDLIFSRENQCLQKFEADTVIHVFFTVEELWAIDNCNTMPEINFGEYTIIAGKITVSSDSDSISDIELLPSSEENQYILKVTIHEPDGRWAVIGYRYFWRLYPKLNPKSQVTLTIAKD